MNQNSTIRRSIVLKRRPDGALSPDISSCARMRCPNPPRVRL